MSGLSKKIVQDLYILISLFFAGLNIRTQKMLYNFRDRYANEALRRDIGDFVGDGNRNKYFDFKKTLRIEQSLFVHHIHKNEKSRFKNKIYKSFYVCLSSKFFFYYFGQI